MLIQLDFSAVFAQWPLLLRGVAWTIGLTVVGTVLGLLLGTACAWTRARNLGPRPAVLRWAVASYVELVRNTPFIVQLFFLFFGLPALVLKLSPELASVLAMVINLGAYSSEIIRAGIEATPRAQVQAAVSLALSPGQTFGRVVLPPALQKVWPSMVGQIIIVMLGSAVCGQISTPELSYAANLISSNTFRAFEAFIVATLLYLALSMLTRRLLIWVGARFLVGR